LVLVQKDDNPHSRHEAPANGVAPTVHEREGLEKATEENAEKERKEKERQEKALKAAGEFIY